MQADQDTSLGQAVGGIVGLLLGGFLIFKVIQAIAAFVDALEGRDEQPIEDDRKDKEEET